MWTRVGGNGFSTDAGNQTSSGSGTVTCQVDDLVFWAVWANRNFGADPITAPTLQSGSTGAVGTITQVTSEADPGLNHCLHTGWCRVTTAGTVGITGNFSVSVKSAVWIEVWRGGDTSATPIRVFSDAPGESTTPNSGQVTPTVGDLLVGLTGLQSSLTTATPTDGTWTERQEILGAVGSTPGCAGYCETKVDTAGALIASAPTASASVGWTAAILAVKPASGGGGGSGRAPWWARRNGGLNGGMQ